MKIFDKIFGGIRMTWPRVVLFAVLSAFVTALFVMIPTFSETSFHNMGVCLEAWVLLALFIILNCEKVLEAGLKTLVFFLISQPLIYLIQVPFSSLGFGLFRYYIYWAEITLLTFPGAMLAWFLKKHNWMSVAVVTLINVVLLGIELPGHLTTLVRNFPMQLFACIFIIAEVLLLLFLCLRDKGKRLIAALAAAGIFLAALLLTTNLIFTGTASNSTFLEGEAPFTVVSCDDGLEITIHDNVAELKADTYGTYQARIQSSDGQVQTIEMTFNEQGVSVSS